MQAGTGIAELVAQETAKQVIVLISCNKSSICNYCLKICSNLGHIWIQLHCPEADVHSLIIYFMSGENIIGGSTQENMALGHTCKRLS